MQLRRRHRPDGDANAEVGDGLEAEVEINAPQSEMADRVVLTLGLTDG